MGYCREALHRFMEVDAMSLSSGMILQGWKGDGPVKLNVMFKNGATVGLILTPPHAAVFLSAVGASICKEGTTADGVLYSINMGKVASVFSVPDQSPPVGGFVKPIGSFRS